MKKVPTNPVNWFQIPVADMDRAVKFYEEILGYTLERHSMGESAMAFFHGDLQKFGTGGMLVKDKASKPSAHGTQVYFASPSGNLEHELRKVEKAGGKVLQAKTSIGEFGFMGLFADTEGNTVALHSLE